MSSTPAQSSEFGFMTPLCFCDDVNHEKSIPVNSCESKFGSPSPPKKKRDLLTWSTHFGTDALTSKRSFKAVCSLQGLPEMPFMINHFGPSNSGHFFLNPKKMFQGLNIFGGDIHQVFGEFSQKKCPKSKVGLRASAGAVHLGCSPSP